MATCASCGNDNPSGFSFCGACGTALMTTQACSQCGFANATDQRFCGRCGIALHAVAPTAATTEPRERKFATVLFADVVGFTALAEATDPETLAGAVDSALRRMADVVVEHGGTIDKYLGDALMALFGVPVAHEDDAERAVSAALRMCETGGDLRFSVGINTGEVMVTPVGDNGSVTVIGDAVNVAARLEAAAGAGEILVGPLTAELVAARFALREREPTILKGKSRPIAVFEVTGTRDDDRTGVTSSGELIGRDAEVAFLTARWDAVTRSARPHTILLAADAGVGKTRLLDEVVATIASGALVARATCPAYGALVGSRLALDLSRQLGIVADEMQRDGAPGAVDERAAWRVRRRIVELTAERPLLVLIDNAHNASAADLEPAAQLMSRLGDAAVMLVVAGRPQPDEWLGAFKGSTTLQLQPLGAGDAEALAAALTAEHGVAPESALRLAAQSGGNPLHLRELVKLASAHGRPASGNGAAPMDERLPPTLQAVLAARLDALSASDKVLLQDVAVFSEGATAEELAALESTTVETAIDRLLGAGLLRERESRFEVADPLLREVAYEQLPHAVRADRHRRAAAVATTAVGRARHLGLAVRYQPDDQELRATAAAELARAGIELLELGRLRDGSRLVHHAIELGHDEPSTLLRLAQAVNDGGPVGESAAALLDRIDTSGDPLLEAEVLHARGNALRGTNLEASAAALGEVAQRWEQLGNESKHAWALANRGLTLFDLGRIDDAAADHMRALEIFTRLGDREAAAAAAQSLALERPDDPRVPDWLTDGLRLAEETGNLARERNALIPLVWFHFIRNHLGGDQHTAEARREAERLSRVCADMGDATFEVQAHCILAVIDRMSGRFEPAHARMTRAHGAMRELGPDSEHHYSRPLLDAVDFMVRCAEQPERGQCPAPSLTPSPLAVMADTLVVEALLLAGRFEEAAAHLRGSMLEGIASVSAFFARLLGVVGSAVRFFAGGAGDDAARVREARDAARTLGAYPNEVATTALLAHMLARDGALDDARAELSGLRENPGGFAGILLLRAAAITGDGAAAAQLESVIGELRAPGLSLRLSAAAS